MIDNSARRYEHLLPPRASVTAGIDERREAVLVRINTLRPVGRLPVDDHTYPSDRAMDRATDAVLDIVAAAANSISGRR